MKAGPSNALTLVPKPSSPSTEMDRLSKVEKQVIQSLGRQSEEEILITRRGAKRLGGTAWRIEVACDAELVARASLARARRGRGNRDISKRGVSNRSQEGKGFRLHSESYSEKRTNIPADGRGRK